MPAKIRLQRHGKKGRPFFHIVVADSRAPRDGRFIERIGSYNPISNPATIDLNFEKATEWVMNGAQPTDTTRAILSYKGVLYRVHLNKGVKKGALTQEQADAKFNAWMEANTNKIEGKKSRLASEKSKDNSARLAAETKANEARLEARKRKEAEALLAAQPAEESAEAPAEDASSEEAPAEA
ncbi:MAG: 30S ribosomal protein S16 [Bacteroidota bacterium]